MTALMLNSLLTTPLQGFWQRLQNLRARNKVYKQYARRQKTRAAMLKETGFEHLPFFKAGVSTSAAVIVNADWGLEYPCPAPPRINVSFHSRLPMHRFDVHIPLSMPGSALVNFLLLLLEWLLLWP